LETGSRQTYTGTKLETADTAKGSLWSTAPILDPTVGALGRERNVQGVRLTCGRRAPPRIWTILSSLRVVRRMDVLVLVGASLIDGTGLVLAHGAVVKAP
jgi:hypothetical protein